LPAVQIQTGQQNDSREDQSLVEKEHLKEPRWWRRIYRGHQAVNFEQASKLLPKPEASFSEQ